VHVVRRALLRSLHREVRAVRVGDAGPSLWTLAWDVPAHSKQREFAVARDTSSVAAIDAGQLV
jgi:hypothetical protein